MKVVSFEEWESGRVKLSDEIFDPVFGSEPYYTYEDDQIFERYAVVGYRGRVTGTRLGLWFSEISQERRKA